MTKLMTILCFSFLISFSPSGHADSKTEKQVIDRSKIGPTFTSPVLYEKNLYFVAITGVLYKSNLDLSNPEILFDGKKPSMATLALSGSVVYWGEGLHEDKISTLRAFDLKTKKLLKEIKVDGHIERGAFIHNDVLYVGMGDGGVAAFKVNTLDKIWQTKEANAKKMHNDGNIVLLENKICTTSIYNLKAIVCFDPLSGKVTNTFALKKSPKSEITTTGSLIVGFATEATFTDSKNWNIPSDFYVVDLLNNKITVEKELRGFNFFAPAILDNQAFVTLSTGDFITVSLKNGTIGYIGEFAEPFINNSFLYKNNLCAVGIMGKFMCYSKNKNGYGIANDSRFMETPIGKIALIEGKYYAPSRMGYFIVE